MTGLFTPKIPKVRDVPVPRKTDAEVESLARDQRRSVVGSPSASWATGGTGVPSSSLSFGASKLLGGGG